MLQNLLNSSWGQQTSQAITDAQLWIKEHIPAEMDSEKLNSLLSLNLQENDGSNSETEKYLPHFLEYLAKYGKDYANEKEFSMRFANFIESFKMVEEHNEKRDGGITLGLNRMSDMTKEEKKRVMSGVITTPKPNTESETPVVGSLPTYYERLSFSGTLPASMDWAPHLPPVRQQGACGSCWAFTTTGILEGLMAIKHGYTTHLSPQQLLDCASNTQYGNNGCTGGSVGGGLRYFGDFSAVSDQDYPYKTAVQASCTPDVANKGLAKVSSINRLYPHDPDQLRIALTQGPISLYVDAQSNPKFEKYRGGIIDHTDCSTSVDHGVTAVGYGYDAQEGKHYIKFKNSWGTDWGENGYGRLHLTTMYDQLGVCGSLTETYFARIQ